MALVTVTELKNYLRIETTAEDTVLAGLFAQAKGWAQSLIQTPITAVSKTFTDRAETCVAYGVVRSLLIPQTPIKLTSPAPVIKDADDATVDATTYTVDGETGIVYAKRGYTFPNGPYTITATVGLSILSTYSLVEEPIVNALILGLGAQLYNQRNPNATQESSGGGISVSYSEKDVPSHLMGMVYQLRPGGGTR